MCHKPWSQCMRRRMGSICGKMNVDTKGSPLLLFGNFPNWLRLSFNQHNWHGERRPQLTVRSSDFVRQPTVASIPRYQSSLNRRFQPPPPPFFVTCSTLLQCGIEIDPTEASGNSHSWHLNIGTFARLKIPTSAQAHYKPVRIQTLGPRLHIPGPIGARIIRDRSDSLI